MKKILKFTKPQVQKAPFVFDSPHSGTRYPDSFSFICDVRDLRRSEDMYVDQLFSSVVEQGIPFLKAFSARSFIDLNRAPIAKNNAERKFGLVRLLSTPQKRKPIYDTPVTEKEIQERIDQYHKPYHDKLKKLVENTQKSFGRSYLINCHSMPSRRMNGDKNPYDIILGDSNGKTCSDAFTKLVAQELSKMGYNVGINIPGYRGAYIVHKYSDLKENKNALQIEINRSLYMDETNFQKTVGFKALKKDLEHLLQKMISYDQKLYPTHNKKEPYCPKRRIDSLKKHPFL